MTGVLLEDLPPDAVRAVAAAAGGRPLAFAPVGGFFASDLAGIVTGPAGRLFVKAVRAGRPMAADYRLEADVVRAMPAAVPAPRLRLAARRPPTGCSWVSTPSRAARRPSRGSATSWLPCSRRCRSRPPR